MADKRNIDSVAFEEAIKEIASKMPKSVGDVGGVSWSDVKGRPVRVSDLPNDVEYQTKAQVDERFQQLIGAAPADLDTLEELASKLQDGDEIHTALIHSISEKAGRSEIPTKYAGSASTGGAATSANKLNTNAGSETQPIYFKNGVPVACEYTLSKSVPTNAEFTDTVYTTNANSGIIISSTHVITLDSAGTNRLGGIKTGYDAANQNTSMDFQYPGRTCPVKLDKDGNAYAIIPQKIPDDTSELNNNSGFLTSVSWSDIDNKPTTIAQYGITDAKIANGVITLGTQTITPIQKGTDASKVLLANGSTINYYKAAAITSATSDDGVLTPLGMKNWTEKNFQPKGDVPKKLSELSNDCKFVTESDVRDTTVNYAKFLVSPFYAEADLDVIHRAFSEARLGCFANFVSEKAGRGRYVNAPDDLGTDDFSLDLFNIGEGGERVVCERMTTSSGGVFQRIVTPDKTTDWKKMLDEDDIQAISRPAVLECDVDMKRVFSDGKGYEFSLNVTNFWQIIKYGKVILKCKWSSETDLEWEIPMVAIESYVFQRSIKDNAYSAYINIQIIARQTGAQTAALAISIRTGSLPLQ